MSWYKTGQVSATNASRVVTGIGTNFTRFAEAGSGGLSYIGVWDASVGTYPPTPAQRITLFLWGFGPILHSGAL